MKDQISTQNMTAPAGLSDKGISKPNKNPEDCGPMPVVKRNVFTDLERKELKAIFREVLSEYGLIRMVHPND